MQMVSQYTPFAHALINVAQYTVYTINDVRTSLIIAERSEAYHDCGSHSRLCMTSATDQPRACVADWSCVRVRHPARAYV